MNRICQVWLFYTVASWISVSFNRYFYPSFVPIRFGLVDGYILTEVSLNVKSPRNHETLPLPKRSSTRDITVRYNVTSNSPGVLITPKQIKQYRTCYELFDTLSEDSVVRHRCAETADKEVVFEDVGVGDYIISLYIMLLIDDKSNQMVSEKIMRRVIVGNDESLVDVDSKSYLLDIKSYEYVEATNTMTVVAPPNAETASVSIHYGISMHMEKSSEELEYCLKIVFLAPNTVESALEFTCIELGRNPFTITNMRIENYLVFMMLRNINTKKIIEGTRREMFLSVRSTESSLPTIIFPPCKKKDQSSAICINNDFIAEGVVDTDVHEATISLQYELFGFPSSYRNVKVCASVTNTQSNLEMMSLRCLPQDKNVMTLHNLKVGKYQVNWVLAAFDDESMIYEASRKELLLELRYPVEFLPTYDWQPLHAWHTIPSGVETR